MISPSGTGNPTGHERAEGRAEERTAIEAALATGLAGIVTLGLRVLRQKVLAVWLGPEGFGLVGVLQSSVDAATAIPCTVLNTAAVAPLARSLGQGDSTGRAAWPSAIRWFAWIAGGALCLLVAGGIRASSGAGLARAGGWGGAALIGLAAWAAVLGAAATGWLRAQARVRDLAWVDVGGTLGGLGLLALALAFLPPTLRVSAAVLASSIAAAALALWAAGRRLPREVWGSDGVMVILKQLARGAVPILVAEQIPPLVRLLMRLWVGRRQGELELGILVAAETLKTLASSIVLGGIAASFLQAAARAPTSLDASRLFGRSLHALSWLMTPLALGLWWAAPWVVPLVYSGRFSVGVGLVRLVVSTLMMPATWLLGALMVARGAAARLAVIEAVAGFAQLACLVRLGTLAGPIAPGVAILLGEAVALGLSWAWASRRFEVSLEPDSRRGLWILGWATGAFLAATAFGPVGRGIQVGIVGALGIAAARRVRLALAEARRS